MKKNKTNAMRILESKKIDFEIINYEVDENIDGISVANKVGLDLNIVFKTLVTIGADNNNYVFVIPVNRELDLKKAAKSVNVKKIEMIHVKDIKKITGYIRGGCSPIGMKKLYKTVLDNSAMEFNQIYVSGGKLGAQIKISPRDLIEITDADIYDLVK
ncbi:Cys-tRNA(Pro) deacylase [Miniphocaeibacter halophilus]|uniref:Cys-tRNA(Pro) deacylase n=1 Tax=Miniphocaeibacter halophilus TaxID=2931922 RepID=A0AC61MT46_9FIRM|nr:Cys-tRNA(Pro) deacylase [Miniphocaeibacter halophilus]QQK08870.1 Cys-tRNA(Pro) deacylase [Miniphocaeibacter halophilus]